MRPVQTWQLVLAAALVAAVLTTPAGAQLQTGSLFGTVVSDQGDPLPGVTVTLSGVGAPQVQTSDGQGRFRFPGLAPGAYRLASDLDGYSPVEVNDLTIGVGRNTEIQVTLSPAVRETVTVEGDQTPILDERRFSSGTTYTHEELEKVPTARDPWALLRTTPGVLLDRINVGGNYSGTQAMIVGPGAQPTQTVWSLDGMVVTDMSAVGTPAGYFDFDAFEEVQVTTGGNDASIATGGVVLNMVTRRGTDRWRGSAHLYYSDSGLRSGLDFDESELAQPGPWNRNRSQPSFKQGNRIVKVEDYGLELGGPLVRDHLWIWGSYSVPQVNLLTISDYRDDTNLEAGNLKLNAQLSRSNSATLFFWQDEKEKHGVGAGPLNPPETTWDQSRFGPRPTSTKLEDSHIFSPRVYASAFIAQTNGGFRLTPGGGDHITFLDDASVWHNNNFAYQSERPHKQVRGEASVFFDTRGLSHELRFSAGYRQVDLQSSTRWPGGGWEFSDGSLLLSRSSKIDLRGEYTEAFIQDTLTSGRLTVNAGVRYDRQGGRNRPVTVEANPVAPDLLPAASWEGGDVGFEWENIVPRLGATWALTEDRKTLLRASYSRYADQLDTDTGAFLSPFYTPQYLYFYTTNNGGPVLTRDEILDEFAGASGGINPFTGETLISDGIDPNLSAPLTDEVLLGLERALRPDFVVGLRATWRRDTDILDQELLVFDDANPRSPKNLQSIGRLHRRDDYVPAGTTQATAPDGRTYTVTYWTLKPGVTSRGGHFLRNGDREREYRGLILTFDKRLSNRWMLRGNATLSDWKWKIPDSAIEDPTNLSNGGVVDDSDVVVRGGGRFQNVFTGSPWSYAITGLYQIAPQRRWGFDVAGILTGREGYPVLYSQRVLRTSVGAGLVNVPLTSDVGAYRYPDVHVLDLRVAKEFPLLRDGAGLTLSLDCFNALNSAYVLQRQSLLGQTNSDFVLEVLGTRILRLGARLSLR
ncbi:MAG TPA: carboxypeptidase regulatory-like domain-containing protein [Thermoanaerobaculia bacterium]|jgi:hypothetical protein|nr:carboxypeptidase regulatory-like domain-containing protein [Thermoanaerobaculia bacterium]